MNGMTPSKMQYQLTQRFRMICRNALSSMHVGPRGAVCAGMYGSGSTWLYNIVLSLLKRRAPEGKVSTFYSDHSDQTTIDKLRCNSFFVLKTHQPDAVLRTFIHQAPVPLFLSIRDPRDAIASLMRRFDLSFEDALSWVGSSAESLLLMSADPRTLLLRYENGFVSSPDTLRLLATRLSIRISAAEIDEIMRKYSADALRRQLQAWRENNVFSPGPPVSVFDEETQWHPNHIGDGQVGQWHDVLGPEQAATVMNATQTFRKRFSYPS